MPSVLIFLQAIINRADKRLEGQCPSIRLSREEERWLEIASYGNIGGRRHG
ncbi:hypothetical protein [Cohnella sp. AR92]|uniref:hypothetical protein n=1 Tax=Cohnella sp. AR92 TaxID=648716 RepID=UPI001315453F|nr:hypothetical protein [Cohnella sp. AR92]